MKKKILILIVIIVLVVAIVLSWRYFTSFDRYSKKIVDFDITNYSALSD